MLAATTITVSQLGLWIGVIALFATLILGFGGIVVAIILGLRGFNSGISKGIDRIETIVKPLASVPTDVEISKRRLDDLYGIAQTSLQHIVAGQTGGTVIARMPNLGLTKVSATPGPESTQYRIETENPVLSAELIGKISLESDFEGKSTEMFGSVTRATDLGLILLLLNVPSTDATLCAEFMKNFVEWLDTTYYEARIKQVGDFERGIFD